MLKQLKNNNGLTLVEILAALVLLSIVLVTFMTFFTQSAKFTANNHETLTAVQVAEDIVGKIRNTKSIALTSFSDCSTKQINENTKDPGKVTKCKVNGNYNKYEVILIEKSGPVKDKENKDYLKTVEIKVKSINGAGINNPEFQTEMYYEVN